MRKILIVPILAGLILCTGCAGSTDKTTSKKTTEDTVTTKEAALDEGEEKKEEASSEKTTQKEITTKETTTKETTTKETTTQETTTEETTTEEVTTKKQSAIKFREVNEVVYVTKHTYVYSKYNTESDTTGELGYGNSLKRVGICNGWSQVEFEGEIGYVLTECLSTDKPVEKTLEYYDEQFAGDCFIGDSRTQGLFNTSQIITADFLCSVGQNISDVRTDEKTLNHLKTKKYRNIYIEFGINEMGWSDLDKYC